MTTSGFLRCKKCGANMDEGAKLCTTCGTHVSGFSAENVARARTAGKAGFGMVIGAVVAIVCGLIWGAIVIGINYEIGYVAWGIGLATGFTMVSLGQETSVRIGVVAAIFAMCGILVGKAVPAAYESFGSGSSLSADDILEESDLGITMVAGQMEDERSFTPDTMAKVDADDENYPPEAIAEATVRFNTLSQDEKRALVEPIRVMLSEFRPPFMEMFKASFGVFDLLWFALAMGTAFKVGNGGDD